MGYEWHPIFRQTPDNGSAVLLDTRLAFAEIEGPQRIEVRYEPDMRRREDVNRRARSRVFGFRLRVTLHCYFDTMSDAAHLIDVVNRLAREDWQTELSLNAGVKYYAVELEQGFRGPEPFRGKTFAGATFELPLRTVELLPEIPYIGSLLTPVPSAGGSVLPVAGPEWKWTFWTVEGPPDVTYQCLRNAASGWEWIEVASA